jgi:hypothetical protein
MASLLGPLKVLALEKDVNFLKGLKVQYFRSQKEIEF